MWQGTNATIVVALIYKYIIYDLPMYTAGSSIHISSTNGINSC